SGHSVGNLKYFETFSAITVTSRLKRSRDSQELIKDLKFTVFKRNFHLILKSGTNVLAKDFHAKLVEADGRTTSVHIDQSLLYTGYLVENTSVLVSAHIEDTLWTIQIHEYNDTYGIEPARNMLKSSDNPLNHMLIAYRSSDLTENAGKCATRYSESNDWIKQYLHPHHVNITSENHNQSRERLRRETYLQKNTCVMSIIADYDFFSIRCHSNYLTCSAIIISLVEHADRIFRSSKFVDLWNTIYLGIGLQIGHMLLYTAPTYTSDTRMSHFNAKGILWDSMDKMNSLEYYLSFRQKHYCITHLLTSYPMPERILGVADVKGICCGARPGGTVQSCSFTSSIDSSSGHLTTQQMKQTFTHAHNFGAEHDTNIPECSQPVQSGGNYIMWYRVDQGTEPNNKIFSICTLKTVGDQITKISCLESRSTHISMCGNGVVDHGEECDAGAIGLINADICCTRDCKFHPGAVCSDINTQCCANCLMAHRGTVCYDPHVVACRRKSYCTGDSYTCPRPQNLPNWTPCLEGGMCHNGECKGFCEIKSLRRNLSLKACMCIEPDEDVCKWCCYDNSDSKNPGPCVAHSTVTMKNGRSCYYGYCEDGVCKSKVVSSIRRITSYIQSVPRLGYIKFLKSNIVFLVVTSSLTLWYLHFLAVSYYPKVVDMWYQYLDERSTESDELESVQAQGVQDDQEIKQLPKDYNTTSLELSDTALREPEVETKHFTSEQSQDTGTRSFPYDSLTTVSGTKKLSTASDKSGSTHLEL
ncbi:ADAM 17 protease isoform X1, partial [Biomphalaria glabrata]